MQPTKNETEITARMPFGPISSMPMAPSSSWGIWAKEMTQENAAPAPTRMNTTAVMSPVDLAMA